jgi:hypothetical protein
MWRNRRDGRFGDGTLTDNQTGLMWEMHTTACQGEVTCVNTTYQWTGDTTTNLAEGDLFGGFLSKLNGGIIFNPSTGQYAQNQNESACFANHCDWRLPSVPELTQIIFKNSVCDSLPGFPCINPAFGATQAAFYWSSTTTVFGTEVLVGVFNSQQGGTFSQAFPKGGDAYARAVRKAW